MELQKKEKYSLYHAESGPYCIFTLEPDSNHNFLEADKLREHYVRLREDNSKISKSIIILELESVKNHTKKWLHIGAKKVEAINGNPKTEITHLISDTPDPIE